MKLKSKQNSRVILLKLIEILFYAFTFFIILFRKILPKHWSDAIYDFGLIKFVLIIASVLIVTYIILGFKEKDYIYQKYNRKHMVFALPMFIIGLIFAFIMLSKAL